MSSVPITTKTDDLAGLRCRESTRDIDRAEGFRLESFLLGSLESLMADRWPIDR